MVNMVMLLVKISYYIIGLVYSNFKTSIIIMKNIYIVSNRLKFLNKKSVINLSQNRLS